MVQLEFAWEFRRWRDGRVISTTPMGERCELMYGAPCYVAHRADLRRPSGAPCPRKRCASIIAASPSRQSRRSADLEFVSASGRILHVDADAAIGDDGIDPVIRDCVAPPEPRFSGLCAFRCLVPAERAPEMALRPVHTLWLGTQPFRALSNLDRSSHQHRGDCACRGLAMDGGRRDFGSGTRVRTMGRARASTYGLSNADQALGPLRSAAVGAVDSWTGSAAGDTAHAMLPFLAQGAAQCVEDAVTLADCLKSAASDTIEQR